MAGPDPAAWATPLIWVRSVDKDTSWNGDSRADPASGTGGVPVPNWVGQLFYAIVQGDNGNLYCATDAMKQAGDAPVGFFPGFPAQDGTPSQLDGDKLYGDAVIIENLFEGNASYGACQTHDGWRWGAFYIEIQCISHDFFAAFLGGGFGYEYPGLDYNYWANNCTYGPLDNNGGAGVISATLGGAFVLTLSSCGTPEKTLFSILNGTIVGIAMSVAPHFSFQPGVITPVTLPCIPCCFTAIGA